MPICPICKEEIYSEITGWCANYHEPLIEGDCMTGPNRPMCCGYIYKVENAFYCDTCNMLLDVTGKSVHLNNAVGQAYCPVGNCFPTEEG